jgi:DNA-binding CsgD family transcriptional regulator
MLKSRFNGARHIAWVQSVDSGDFKLENQTRRLLELIGDKPAMVVLISRVDRDRPIDASFVGVVLGLTPAEGRLAAALAKGDSLTTYALTAGIARNTARAQLASIFDKTGTSRQAELVALIWRSVSAMGTM